MNDAITPRSTSPLRQAMTLFRPAFLLRQGCLVLVVALLFLFWLRIPDASWFQVLLSVLIGLITVAVAGLGQSAVLLQLCATPWSRQRLLRGLLLFVVMFAVWLTLYTYSAKLDPTITTWAGYLNSRFPRSLRPVFSFARLDTWLTQALSIACWALALLLLALLGAALASAPLRAVVRVLRSLVWWVLLCLGAWLAVTLTTVLVNWVPGHTLGTALFSLGGRLLLVSVVDLAISCFLLALAGALVRSSQRT